jgi:serine/threonine protein kinase
LAISLYWLDCCYGRNSFIVWIHWLRRRKYTKSNEAQKEDEINLLNDVQDRPTKSETFFELPTVEAQPTIPFVEIVLEDKLGEGSFGEIFRGKWNGQNIALKKLKPNIIRQLNVLKILEEAKTLTSLRHKHIVLSMGITTDSETNEILILMEYMKNGSLDDLLFKDKVTLSLSEVVQLALDIAKGLNYLHCLTPKIIHRDLKSANVLLYHNKKRAKLSDFGTARLLRSSSAANTVIGTLGFIAPEVLQQAPYNEKADVYSFGVLLYEMVTNTHLPIIFEQDTRFKKIHESVDDSTIKDIIIDCFRTDPNQRPTIRQCIDKLKLMKYKN